MRNIIRFLSIFPNTAMLMLHLIIFRPELVYVNTIDKALPVIIADIEAQVYRSRKRRSGLH